MEKIEKINLAPLRNNEHFQFMTDVDKMITTSQASELGIDSLYPDFKSALNAEDAAMRVELGSIKSKTIEECDKQGGNTWSAISMRTNSALLSPFPNEVASAEIIRRAIDLYGDVRTLTYNEESAATTNLVADLLLPVNAEHLNRVGIQRWVAELKNENEQFQTAFNDRNTEFAGREIGDVRAIRGQIDPVYEKIIEKMNASIVMEVAKPAAISFASALNEKIKYYKTTLASRSSRGKKAEKVSAAKE
jgi:hypothetical protein